MKAEEIRELADDELTARIAQLEEERFRLRFRSASEALEEPLRLRTLQVLWVLVLVAAFQMLTSPVAAHMVSRAGFRTGKVRHDLLVVDELSRVLATRGAARFIR